jgi:hypothetical protein
MEKPLFLLLSRTQTPEIEKKIRSLVKAGIDAYAIIDNEPVSGKRFITYSDEFMKERGWTNHMSYSKLPITAWDKATYHAFKSGKEYTWLCEDDVYWNTPKVVQHFYNHASKADLIAYPLAPSYDEHPKWFHWSKVELLTPKKKYWMATYNQFCRVSHRLLEKMHELSLKRKRLYFHEGMFATLCNINGWTIQYLNELRIQELFVQFHWGKTYTSEQVKELIKEHGHILIHPVKIEI